MKKLITLIAVLSLTACASLAGGGDATKQSAQTAYVKSCAAYNAAFNAALQLRIDGQLNQAQIDQVTMIDSQITPICTGPLPADPDAATQQVTAAVTTFMVLEAINRSQVK